MKVGVATHPKFLRLVRHLRKSGCIGEVSPNLIAIGLLEGLWNLTAQHCKRGDIGKMDNVDIAEGLHWHGNEDDLVGYLVDSGWIDECEDDRLVIHDWAEHCPTFVKGVISRSKENFTKSATKLATKSATKSTTKSDTIVANLDADSDALSGQLPSQAYPSQVKSSQSKPSQELSIVPSIEGDKEKPKTKTQSQNERFDLEFEPFWKQLLPINRGGDDKQTAKIKFRACRKIYSESEVYLGVKSWEDMNTSRDPEFRKGLSSWLKPERIKQELSGDSVPMKPKRSKAEVTMDALDAYFDGPDSHETFTHKEIKQ